MDFQTIHFQNKSYFQFPELIELGLNHCFTTSDTDMRFPLDTDPSEVLKAYKNIEDLFHVESMLFYHPRQTHSDHIRIIEQTRESLRIANHRFFDDTDALITQQRDVALTSKYADCTPILIYDPIQRVQANIHSGWRGTSKHIFKKTIDLLQAKYSCKSENLHLAIGPSIGTEAFEVENDVRTIFLDHFSDVNRFISQKSETKYTIDLKELHVMLFEQSDIEKNHIFTIPFCTYSTPVCHSYRRDKEHYQLMAAVSSIASHN